MVVSKFVDGAKEIEFDGVANAGKLVNYAISEHVEQAGVHSGDATLILPAQSLYTETTKRIKKIAKQIASALQITGPFNIQFLSKENHIKVIECNLRASRSFPFVSKTFNVNFIDLATRAMVLGSLQNQFELKQVNFNIFDMDYVCVKSPMFSFTRLAGADPVLRVEMASTGEVACFGNNRYEAFLMALTASGLKLPIPNPTHSTDIDALEHLRLDYVHTDLCLSESNFQFASTESNCPSASNSPTPKSSEHNSPKSKSELNGSATPPFGSPAHAKVMRRSDSAADLMGAIKSKAKNGFRSNFLISIGPQKAKYAFVECASLLAKMGFTIYATENTHLFYRTHSIETTLVSKPSETSSQSNGAPSAVGLIESGQIHFVLNIPQRDKGDMGNVATDGFQIRRKAVDFNVPLISNVKLAKLFVRALAKKYIKSYEFAFDDEFIHIKSWKEYMQSAGRY